MHHPPVRITLFPSRSATWRTRIDEHPELDHHETADAAQCFDLVTRGRIDAVVVDVGADDPGGVELIRALAGMSVTPVAVSVGPGWAEGRAALLEHGATVVVDPTISDRELVAQLRSVCDLTTSPGDGPLRFHPESMEVEWNDRRTAVTETQWKLLAVLNAEPGRHFSAAELMEQVWGYTAGPTSTVSVHMRRLRLRLEDDPSRPTLICTTRGRGYALAPSDSAARAPAPQSAVERRLQARLW